ncbi:MAG TPA: hypothetical protein VMU84_11015 [Thermoanaerobaculia bacterium]|nr:hypothetical protein [Thermoanaerobaculia bacterium]
MMLRILYQTPNVRAMLCIGREVTHMVDWDEIAKKKHAEIERLKSDQERKERRQREFKVRLPTFADELFNHVVAEVERKNATIAAPGALITIHRSPLQLRCTKSTSPSGGLEMTLVEPSEQTATTTLGVEVWGTDIHTDRRSEQKYQFLIWSNSEGQVFARQTEGHGMSGQELNAKDAAEHPLKTFAWFIA